MTLALSTINISKANLSNFFFKWGCLVLLFHAITINELYAQSQYGKDTSLFLASGNIAHEKYMSTFEKRALFYNGSEYIRPATGTKGHPFFEYDELQKGNVLFDGVLYKDVMIALDIVSGVLTTVGYQNIQLQLPTEKINHFTINNHLFIPLWDESIVKGKQSFFEVLYQNELKVLVQHKKTSAQSFRPEDPYVFKNSVTYFIQKDNTLTRITNEKTLLETLAGQKDAIKKFMRNNRLNMNTMPVQTIKRSVDHYQQLKK